ncbi:MAG: hypothetical protein B6244_11505 [Candidatus Cloacimonetes bacterium 4572_55]|nr:MAG: hypothetical protein B6244_11505 [Candidatus Cloacimonetes bacterium 4572_55]
MNQTETILIADDSPTVTYILGHLLEQMGYSVQIAEDGIEAIEAVYRINPDLILLDVEMPKMNGYQVCRLLKNSSETSHIPIIILTSRDQKMDRFWGLSTGADEYVTKDLEPELLLKTIAEHLSTASKKKAPAVLLKEISERSLLEQVNSLLDKQLFHSTLVNQLGALVANYLSVDQTARSILNLLDNVCEFAAAAVIWRDRDQGNGMLHLQHELEATAREQLFELLDIDCKEHNFSIDPAAFTSVMNPNSAGKIKKKMMIQSYWSQPLTIRDSIIGILAIGNYNENSIRPEIEETLCIFCKETSIILDNAILFDKLEVSNRNLEKTLHELKDTQAQLVHSEKMASLGQLVAGVAHELNNPISFIYGNMDYLEEYVVSIKKLIRFYRGIPLPTPFNCQANALAEGLDLEYILGDLDKVIQSCRNGAERTRQIVLDLRNFSRLDRSEVGQLHVEDGIEGTLNLLTNKYKHRIKIHKDFGETPPIECYAGQLNQVFMNLLSNAADAIDGKGNVWIQTEYKDQKVTVAIKDDGCGIPENKLPKIFDPSRNMRAPSPSRARSGKEQSLLSRCQLWWKIKSKSAQSADQV